jgi:hypothetical protein
MCIVNESGRSGYGLFESIKPLIPVEGIRGGIRTHSGFTVSLPRLEPTNSEYLCKNHYLIRIKIVRITNKLGVYD